MEEHTLRNYRVTFNPRAELPEGLDVDGYAVIEAVGMDDALAAASKVWPGLWNMIYREDAWSASHLVHLFPAGELARLTTGAATIAGLAGVDCPTCGTTCKGHMHFEGLAL